MFQLTIYTAQTFHAVHALSILCRFLSPNHELRRQLWLHQQGVDDINEDIRRYVRGPVFLENGHDNFSSSMADVDMVDRIHKPEYGRLLRVFAG